jgi:hypothetical protein
MFPRLLLSDSLNSCPCSPHSHRCPHEQIVCRYLSLPKRLLQADTRLHLHHQDQPLMRDTRLPLQTPQQQLLDILQRHHRALQDSRTLDMSLSRRIRYTGLRLNPSHPVPRVLWRITPCRINKSMGTTSMHNSHRIIKARNRWMECLDHRLRARWEKSAKLKNRDQR